MTGQNVQIGVYAEIDVLRRLTLRTDSGYMMLGQAR